MATAQTDATLAGKARVEAEIEAGMWRVLQDDLAELARARREGREWRIGYKAVVGQLAGWALARQRVDMLR